MLRDQTCSLALSAWSVGSLCWLQGLLILTVGCAEQGIVKALCCVLEVVQFEPSSTKTLGAYCFCKKEMRAKQRPMILQSRTSRPAWRGSKKHDLRSPFSVAAADFLPADCTSAAVVLAGSASLRVGRFQTLVLL